MKKNQILSWMVLGIFLMTLGLWAIPGKVQAATAGSVIGTSTTNLADVSSYQRKSFFANTRFWVFYSNGPNMVFSSSLDGIGWAVPTTVRPATYGEQFSVWFDGASVHYTYASGAINTAVYYRKGTPNAGGTITWAKPEQIAVPAAAGVTYSNPCIAADSNGFPWIGYRKVAGANKFPMITKDKFSDGSWSAQSGFPYDLAGWTAAYWAVIPVPMTGGKMLAIYASSGHNVRARSWNGSAWVGGFTTAAAMTSYPSAVAVGDEVHLVFLQTSLIWHIKYSFATNSLAPEVQVQTGLTGSPAPVLSVDSYQGDLHLFWAQANHIYYKQNSGGKWDVSSLDWIAEGASEPIKNDSLTSFYNADNGKGIFYLTKTASPFNLKSGKGNASISITKKGPTSAYIGDTIAYLFEVKNTGKVALSSVTVTDPFLGGQIYSPPSLAAGASATFSVNYTIKPTDPNPLVNSVKATGYFGTVKVEDSDSKWVEVKNIIQVVKKPLVVYAFDGEIVQYTVWVTNAWTQDVVITKIVDSKYGIILENPTTPVVHGPGVTGTYTYSLTPTGSGPYSNTVTVYAQSLDGNRKMTNTAEVSLYPLIIRKDVVGEEDNTEFEVWIKDYKKIPYPGTKPFKISENSPKKIWLSTGTHWFKEVVLYPNCYRLVADASYVIKYYPQYNSEFAEFVYEAGKTNWKEITFKNKNYCKICIEKSGPAEACGGDKITYNFKVTNCSDNPQTGDQPILYNVAVTDPLFGLNKALGPLNRGEFKEFTQDYTVPVQAGSWTLKNTATATGKHDMAHDGGFPVTTKTVTATDSHTVNVADCRKAQICGFKWDDFNGDGHWTICHHIIFSDHFDNENPDNWIPARGEWVEHDGFLKQTDSSAGNPNDPLKDPLIFYGSNDEHNQYHGLSYRTHAKPMSGNKDFGLVFFAKDENQYYLFRVNGNGVNGASQKVGVYRINGANYETIIEKTFAQANIPFLVENGQVYGMKVNTYDNGVVFYFDEIAKFDKPGELQVITLPILETFGCTSGYLGLWTHKSAVDFDWAFQSTELGIEGWEIKLEGPVNATTITGPDGSYCFTNLPAGNYKVSEVIQPGWAQTYPPASGHYEITLIPGDNVGCVNFGNQLVCLDPPPNMISWWPGDENPWDYVDGNTGTLMGGATYGDGKVGKAFSLNGTDAYVKIENPKNLDIAGDVTIDAWVKIQDLKEGQVASIAGKWGISISLDSYVLSSIKTNGQIVLASGIGDDSTADPGLLGGIIIPNEWTYVAMTYEHDSGKNIIYINGVKVGERTRAGGITPTSVNFFIGAQEENGTGPSRFFPGLIDEVEVFGRALSEDEIKALYNVGSLGKCKPQIAPPAEVK